MFVLQNAIVCVIIEYTETEDSMLRKLTINGGYVHNLSWAVRSDSNFLSHSIYQSMVVNYFRSVYSVILILVCHLIASIL